MMKFFKKTAASLLAAAMLLGATACAGPDNSWAAKTENLTVPIGSYIFYLNVAYNDASSRVTDKAKPVLEQQVDGVDATQWIRDKAMNYVKLLFVIDDKMRELNIGLTEEEKAAVTSAAAQTWAQQEATFKPYGIAQASFTQSYIEYYFNTTKLFNSLYEKGGQKEVPVAELTKYVDDNYVNFSMMGASLTKTDESGAPVAMTDEEKAKVKADLDVYVKGIEDGTMPMKDASADYTKKSEAATDNYGTNLMEDTANSSGSVPEALLTVLKEMKVGEVRNVEVEGTQIILQRDKVDAAASLAGAEFTTRVLNSMKNEEYNKDMEALAAAYTGAQINEAAIKAYNPKMFVKAQAASAAG